MIITPPYFLTICPLCQGKLNIKKMFDKENTCCTKCHYVEPGGSARYVAFVTEVLTEMLIELGVNKIRLAGTDVPSIEGCLQANILLPAIVINAQINSNHLGAALSNINLTTVDDARGYYKKRVITSSAAIKDPAIGLCAMAETLVTAFTQSMKQEQYRKTGTLCLDLLAPISAMQVGNIIKYAHANELEIKSRQGLRHGEITHEQ